MSNLIKKMYCPTLRMKAGELAGVRALAEDVADRIIPRFIIPPLNERDDACSLLFEIENVPNVHSALSRHWVGREALIDATYLIDECGRDTVSAWLPKLFEEARRAQIRAIPMALLRDIGLDEAAAFRSSVVRTDGIDFAICVPSGEMVGDGFVGTVKTALERLKLSPSQCAVIADFHDADFSVPEYVAPIIDGSLELLQEIGQWQSIIFQGTNYPDKNPAQIGEHVLWPRNEWKAWRLAVKFSPDTAEHMMFGDYAADCAKMNFGDSRAPAIRHYRYAIEDAWLIERGKKSGKDKQIMQQVCQNIVDSGHFAGAGFSLADAFILASSKDNGRPGNSTTWRQVNTTHHITRVVADMARVRGVPITERAQEPEFEQSYLF